MFKDDLSCLVWPWAERDTGVAGPGLAELSCWLKTPRTAVEPGLVGERGLPRQAGQPRPGPAHHQSVAAVQLDCTQPGQGAGQPGGEQGGAAQLGVHHLQCVQRPGIFNLNK